MSENDNQQMALPSGEDASGNESPPSFAPRRFGRLRRLGCGFLLVVWFAILLLPCVLIFLATQQEIVISQGDLPGQYLRVWLIMEDGRRGLGFSTTSLQPAGPATSADTQACLQTNVSYLLWEGEGDPARFCDCFARSNPTEAWNLLETYNGACQAGE